MTVLEQIYALADIQPEGRAILNEIRLTTSDVRKYYYCEEFNTRVVPTLQENNMHIDENSSNTLQEILNLPEFGYSETIHQFILKRLGQEIRLRQRAR